jgi:DNA-binding NarL/FixJ family response regulator
LDQALPGLTSRGLTPLIERCQRLRRKAAPYVGSQLTAREREVWTLLAEGLTNKQIASRLTVSPRTVEKHVENLLRKTSTRTRTQLARATDPGSPSPRST